MKDTNKKLIVDTEDSICALNTQSPRRVCYFNCVKHGSGIDGVLTESIPIILTSSIRAYYVI